MHLDDNAMTAFLAGQMSAAEQSGVRAHLDDCAECRAIVVGAVKRPPVLASPSRADTLALGSEQAVPTRPSRRVFEAGAAVGPYVIERLLGAGGMGFVYAARDPRLDRTVALKLIRRTPELGVEQLAERLRRESKALARLSHPNVTTVYELGSAGGEIYIAMEYVAGTTLRAWLDGARREPREILATFASAGRGLAAAHAAGLVHRDFKPDNVLLGDGGIVKVTDFGLATMGDGVFEPTRVDDAALTELTRTGAIVGTPAYMAPEQFSGAAIDARADQFAFCVALYEALVGTRPFTGASLEELSRAVRAGKTEIPRSSRMPARVRRALLRGLHASPEARFAAMDELLAALAPRRRGVMVGVAGVTAAAWAVVGVTLLSASSSPPACEGASAEVAAVWHPARKQTVARAFEAAKAGPTWALVERRLDAYFADWAAMHGDACKATRVHRQQSEAALDLRMACLSRRRAEIDALVGVLERADAEIVQGAQRAMAELPSLAPCADVDALSRRVQPPRDPAARGRHDELRRRLDEARALAEVSQYARAMPLLDALVGEAAIADWPALEAEAQQLRAKIHTARGADAEAETALHRALVRAQTARAEDLVASVAVDLAFAIGDDRKRSVDAMRWVDFAAAAIAGKGGDELLGARLDTVRAAILLNSGKPAEAEAADRAALAVATRLAPGSALEAEVLDALGMALSLQGKFDDAVPTLARAVTATAAVYGPSHSLTATVRMNHGNALGAVRRYDESLAELEQALAIRESLFGADSVQVAMVLSNMGQTLQEQGKLERARPLLERALAIRIAKLGPDAPPVAKTAANLGYLLLDQGAHAAALAQFERAGKILGVALPPDHPARADDLAGVGLAYIGLGKPAKAIAPLTRAVALNEASGGDPVTAASVQAALGHALYKSGRDRARGVKLAREARAVLVAEQQPEGVVEIDAWLPRK